MVIDAIHAVYIEIEYLGDHGYLARIVYRSWALGLAHQLCQRRSLSSMRSVRRNPMRRATATLVRAVRTPIPIGQVSASGCSLRPGLSGSATVREAEDSSGDPVGMASPHRSVDLRSAGRL